VERGPVLQEDLERGVGLEDQVAGVLQRHAGQRHVREDVAGTARLNPGSAGSRDAAALAKRETVQEVEGGAGVQEHAAAGGGAVVHVGRFQLDLELEIAATGIWIVVELVLDLVEQQVVVSAAAGVYTGEAVEGNEVARERGRAADDVVAGVFEKDTVAVGQCPG